MKKLLSLLIFFSFWFSFSAMAQISSENPRIRMMPPGFKSTAAFVVLKNSSDKPVEVVGASAKFAKTIELHTHKVEDGVMRMRQVEKMLIPANGQLELKPHDNHLMIFGVKSDLKEGAKKTIEIKLGDGKEVKIDFEVQDMNKAKDS